MTVDIGTSKTKVAIYDVNGKALYKNSEYHVSNESITEQDPNVWWKETAKLIKKAISQTNLKPHVIGLSGNMHALLSIDKKGDPVRKAILWNDTRAEQEAQMLRKEFGDDVLIDRFLNIPIPGFPLPKIIWLKKHERESYEKTYKFVQPKDFIAFKLCGEVFTDYSDASGTFAFNIKKKRWDEDILKELKIDPSKFPNVVGSFTKIGNVSKEVSCELGLKEGTPVVIGAGDLITSAVGSGVDEKSIVLVIGTAGQIITISKNVFSDILGKIFVFLYTDSNTFLYLGTIPAGGYSCEWFARKILNISLEEFFNLAKKSSKKTKRLIFLPFIQGSGTPFMNYNVKGSFHNLSDTATREDFCRAIIEGIVFSLKISMDYMEKVLGKRKRLILQSLAAKEKAFLEIIEGLHEGEIFIPKDPDASLLGAAIIAGVSIKIFNDLKEGYKKMIKYVNVVKTSEVFNTLKESYKEFINLVSYYIQRRGDYG